MRIVEGIATVEDVNAFVADLSAIGEEQGCAVQAFSARLVAGRSHLETAVERAHRSLERDRNIADDPAVEILLWAAGRRQIDQAMGLGVTAGTGPVAVVIDGPDEDAEERAAEEVR
ncbi:MAG: KEOPS complex subunit Cgi121, partial [Halobacteriales archaeon]|nr:KEOPS complex subunit Cgi121 [Halobacteriales archaeon]